MSMATTTMQRENLLLILHVETQLTMKKASTLMKAKEKDKNLMNFKGGIRMMNMPNSNLTEMSLENLSKELEEWKHLNFQRKSLTKTMGMLMKTMKIAMRVKRVKRVKRKRVKQRHQRLKRGKKKAGTILEEVVKILVKRKLMMKNKNWQS